MYVIFIVSKNTLANIFLIRMNPAIQWLHPSRIVSTEKRTLKFHDGMKGHRSPVKFKSNFNLALNYSVLQKATMLSNLQKLSNLLFASLPKIYKTSAEQCRHTCLKWFLGDNVYFKFTCTLCSFAPSNILQECIIDTGTGKYSI